MNREWIGTITEIERAVTPLHREIDRITAEMKVLEEHLVRIGAGSVEGVLTGVYGLSFIRIDGKFRICYNGRPIGECSREERITAYSRIPRLLEAILKHLKGVTESIPQS